MAKAGRSHRLGARGAKMSCVGATEAWSYRIRGIEPVYLGADGAYMKACLEKDKAALPVIVASLRDGGKLYIGIGVSGRRHLDYIVPHSIPFNIAHRNYGDVWSAAPIAGRTLCVADTLPP